MLEGVDADGDGEVDYNEFLSMMMSDSPAPTSGK